MMRQKVVAEIELDEVGSPGKCLETYVSGKLLCLLLAIVLVVSVG
jgi:hypothetical protein